MSDRLQVLVDDVEDADALLEAAAAATDVLTDAGVDVDGVALDRGGER